MKRILIIGGAGFIGSNSAEFFFKNNYEVTIIDNLSRNGTSQNLKWLQKIMELKFYQIDIRDISKLEEVFKSESKFDVILHLAAQVTVTTSVVNPREDFEINAIGTFNVLEAFRKYQQQAILLYSSTNKVYGGMSDLKIIEKNGRYVYANLIKGIPENRLLDFHSPYGCSKGSADQYVRDYSRIYGLKTIVMRQSCIYGYRQFGVEDQGWVAWFIIASIFNKKITIYGDGKQVRDVLFIEDLIKGYKSAIDNINLTSGQIYNLGGGYKNQLSLLELISLLEKLIGRKIDHTFSDWRSGDQKVFVSNINKAKNDFNWMPKVNVDLGITKLYEWIATNKELFEFMK